LTYSVYPAGIFTDCVYEGVEYKHSDSWRPSNRPCDVCICYNGVVSCRTRTRCQNTCSYGVYSDNECCSPCTGNGM